jgi:hypothetical protein
MTIKMCNEKVSYGSSTLQVYNDLKGRGTVQCAEEFWQKSALGPEMATSNAISGPKMSRPTPANGSQNEFARIKIITSRAI